MLAVEDIRSRGCSSVRAATENKLTEAENTLSRPTRELSPLSAVLEAVLVQVYTSGPRGLAQISRALAAGSRVRVPTGSWPAGIIASARLDF